MEEIEKYIKKTLKLSDKAWNDMIGDAVKRNQDYFTDTLDKAGLIKDSFELDKMTDEINAVARQTKQAFQNITQSLGFAYRAMDGSIQFSPIADMYQHILDNAELRILSGSESYEVAITDAVKELADSGLQYVEYASGYHSRIDVAVRRAAMTGVTQVSGAYSENLADELDTPYREVSAHRGARDKGTGFVNHKSWQGKVYSVRDNDIYPNIYTVCGLGDVAGLEGSNCRHMHFAFFEGISERTWTDEQLAEIDPPDFEYEGKTYTAYEATQKQRQIETAIRNLKRKEICYDAQGNQDAYDDAVIKHRRLFKKYEEFSKAADLPMQTERMQIEGNMPKRKIGEGIFVSNDKSNAPKSNSLIKERKKKTDIGIFRTWNNSKQDSIRPHSIMKEMKKSEYGNEMLEYLQQNKVRIELLYGVDNPEEHFGVYDPFDDTVSVYCDMTKTIHETVLTIIHEGQHRKLIGSGLSAFDEEVECYKAEVLFEKGILTEEDISNIIEMVKEAYPQYVKE